MLGYASTTLFATSSSASPASLIKVSYSSADPGYLLKDALRLSVDAAANGPFPLSTDRLEGTGLPLPGCSCSSSDGGRLLS